MLIFNKQRFLNVIKNSDEFLRDNVDFSRFTFSQCKDSLILDINNEITLVVDISNTQYKVYLKTNMCFNDLSIERMRVVTKVMEKIQQIFLTNQLMDPYEN